MIDQFRGDYINTYGHQWTAGLRRLVDRSAIFPLSAYTYATTKTCPGHSTIATGTLPSTHGMIDNQWYERDERRTVVCTEDASVTPVSFGGIEGREHHSLKRLMTATFADELRTQLPTMPRVVALSVKPRSAIPLAGRAAPGTIAVWAEPNGAWTTSTMYTTTAWPEVDEFVRTRPIASAHGHEWTRRLDPATYLFDDAGLGEPAANVFPHVIAGRSGKPDASFATAWQRSPLSDAYLGEMAANLVDRLKLGQTQGTDLLAVSFSALDLVGHMYGPRSHEVQDVLANLDHTIGRLLAALDKSVGSNRYVIGLTSDHGVPDVPEQAAARSMPAGRLSMTTLRRGLEETMVAALGPGPHVAAVTSPYVYFTPESLGRLKTDEQARQAVTKMLAGTVGVRRVVWAGELTSPSPEDPTLGAVYRSYVPARSGDIMLVFEPVLDPSVDRHDARNTLGLRPASAPALPWRGHHAGALSDTGGSGRSHADAGAHRRDHAGAHGWARADRSARAMSPTRSTRTPSSFFNRVLAIVKRIPPGRVATYGDVARLAGRPGAARAVGNVMREAHEPCVPYHRVIAAGGRVGGYGGHPGLKHSLLMAEGHRLRGHRILGFATRRWPEPDTRSRPARR